LAQSSEISAGINAGCGAPSWAASLSRVAQTGERFRPWTRLMRTMLAVALDR
jgi:hypothetical protein